MMKTMWCVQDASSTNKFSAFFRSQIFCLYLTPTVTSPCNRFFARKDFSHVRLSNLGRLNSSIHVSKIHKYLHLLLFKKLNSQKSQRHNLYGIKCAFPFFLPQQFSKRFHTKNFHRISLQMTVLREVPNCPIWLTNKTA